MSTFTIQLNVCDIYVYMLPVRRFFCLCCINCSIVAFQTKSNDQNEYTMTITKTGKLTTSSLVDNNIQHSNRWLSMGLSKNSCKYTQTFYSIYSYKYSFAFAIHHPQVLHIQYTFFFIYKIANNNIPKRFFIFLFVFFILCNGISKKAEEKRTLNNHFLVCLIRQQK